MATTRRLGGDLDCDGGSNLPSESDPWSYYNNPKVPMDLRTTRASSILQRFNYVSIINPGPAGAWHFASLLAFVLEHLMCLALNTGLNPCIMHAYESICSQFYIRSHTFTTCSKG